jgi:hypothetical protein
VQVLARHLARQGAPVLFLAGEPGIGKTRLLQEAAQRAGSQGWRVLAGGCQRRGGHEPYAPLLGAVQRYLRARPLGHLRVDLQGCAWLVRLLPELAQGPIEPLPAWTLAPEQERRLMVAAIVRFLAMGPARHYTDRALAVAEQSGVPFMIAYLTSVRGGSAFYAGDWVTARRYSERAVTLPRGTGIARACMLALLRLGQLRLCQGSGDEAARYLEESSAIAGRVGHLRPIRWAQALLADCDLQSGRPEAARRRLVPLLDRPNGHSYRRLKKAEKT